MTEQTIRILHFADTHIGVENYGRMDPQTGTSSRVRDFLDRMDEMIDFALEQRVDLVLFAGDAFKDRSPRPTLQREFAQRIKRLADAAPTFLLVGNHDMPAMASRASSVDIFQTLDVPGVFVGDQPGGRVIETRNGPVFLAWMPYPRRNRLLADPEHETKSISDLEAALHASVEKALAKLADMASNHPMPRVLVGHFSIAEAEFGSEKSVMLGREMAITRREVANPIWNYVAMGHLHKHQALHDEGRPPVVYSGSLSRIDFGEEKEEKGFCWVEVTDGETRWRFERVSARPFRTLRLDLQQASSPTEAVLEALPENGFAGAVVRLVLQVGEEQVSHLHEDEILAALEAAKSVRIEKRIIRMVRTRLKDAPESLAPLDLLETYFTMQGLEDSRKQRLLALAGELIHAPD